MQPRIRSDSRRQIDCQPCAMAKEEDNMRLRRHHRLGPLWHGSTSTLVLALETTLLAGTASAGVPEQVTNIFKPLSTPAEEVS